MTTLRRLGYVALVAAFLQIVWGAIVRISGSGMGCGDDWPVCNGEWIPPIIGRELVIELSHRLGALVLTVAVVALLVAALRKRREPGVGGPGGVLRPAVAAAVLVVITALFGAVTVKLGLSPRIVVGHLALAMALIAVLVAAVVRAGGFGVAGAPAGSATPRAARAAVAGAAIAFVVVMLGGFTANLPGAAMACRGFPACTQAMLSGGILHVHLTHRILAFLLALHIIGLAVAYTRRSEAKPLRQLSRAAVGLVIVQLGIAAMLVSLPPGAHARSAHQAVGTAIWVTMIALALVARRLSQRETVVAPETPVVPPEPIKPAPHTVAVWVARGAGPS